MFMGDKIYAFEKQQNLERRFSQSPPPSDLSCVSKLSKSFRYLGVDLNASIRGYKTFFHTQLN